MSNRMCNDCLNKNEGIKRTKKNSISNLLNIINRGYDVILLDTDIYSKSINKLNNDLKNTEDIDNKKHGEHFFEKNTKEANAYKNMINIEPQYVEYDAFIKDMNLSMMYSIIGLIELANTIMNDLIEEAHLASYDNDISDHLLTNAYTSIVDTLLDSLIDNEEFSEDLFTYLINKYGDYPYNN